jgi:hypothetical protein
MPNMSYCRYENTSKDMRDVVDTLFYCDVNEDLSKSELRGLDTILELAKDIVNMEDKIINILDNGLPY